MSTHTLLAPPALFVQPNQRQSSGQLSFIPSNKHMMTSSNIPVPSLYLATGLPTVYPLSIPCIIDDQFAPPQQQLRMSNPSNATVVSNTLSSASSTTTTAESPPAVVIATSSSSSSKQPSKKSDHTNRRHSLPTSIMLPHSQQLNDAVTHPVPEFLCHLFSMLTDHHLSPLISWHVPTEVESDDMGGGMKGIGKIVVHHPEGLQNEVLGKYYRHSCYASFQRQLNYFGFKKRLHGGKKGKLSPCSYVHEKLGAEPLSLFQLKRRPPASKRGAPSTTATAASTELDKVSNTTTPATVSVTSPGKKASIKKARKSAAAESTTTKSAKKQRTSSKQEPKKDKGRNVSFDLESPTSTAISISISNAINCNSLFSNNNQNIVLPPNMPLMVQADSFPPPSPVHSSAIGNAPVAGNAAPTVAAPKVAPKKFTPSSSSSKNYKEEITATRANAAVREAQKSLERAYRKSKREQEAEVNPLDMLMPPPMQFMQKGFQQSVPNPLAVPIMDDTWSHAAFRTVQATFPSSSNNNNSNNNNCFVAPRNIVTQNPILSPAMNEVTQPEERAASPIEFDDIFSKLLSTTLPPSDELFGDEMSTGSLVEDYMFDEVGLQVIDDGMLLP